MKKGLFICVMMTFTAFLCTVEGAPFTPVRPPAFGPGSICWPLFRAKAEVRSYTNDMEAIADDAGDIMEMFEEIEDYLDDITNSYGPNVEPPAYAAVEELLDAIEALDASVDDAIGAVEDIGCTVYDLYEDYGEDEDVEQLAYDILEAWTYLEAVQDDFEDAYDDVTNWYEERLDDCYSHERYETGTVYWWSDDEDDCYDLADESGDYADWVYEHALEDIWNAWYVGDELLDGLGDVRGTICR